MKSIIQFTTVTKNFVAKKPTIVLTIAITAALSATSKIALADSSASSHGPIGVMGDHLHKKGEFMFSYRAMRMNMNGNRIGTNRVSARQVVGTGDNPGQFMVVPLRMTMDMHMFGGMYGLSDNVTLMAMVPYLKNTMDHLVRNGREFTTVTKGIGDTKVSALIGLSEKGQRKLHLGIGLSLPTGSITERDDTPAMSNAVLPYPMQLGSGTYDVLPSITYVNGSNSISWGAQLSAVIRTGTNDESYTLGNRYAATSWLSHEFSHNLSASLRFNYLNWDRIDGASPRFNPNFIQTANTNLQGGERLDISLGVNYLFNNGHRLALEYTTPTYQELNGPQLETDSIVTLGWQKAF